MSSDAVDKLISNTVKGTVEAVIDKSADPIKNWIAKFRNKELAFIGTADEILLVKSQRESPEWTIYAEFIRDSDLSVLIQMGITLRKLEKKPRRLQHLRGAILDRYGEWGLHVAQFTQNQILGKYLASALKSAKTSEDFGRQLEDFLKNIDKFCIFVKQEDGVNAKFKEIVTRVHSLMPPTFVLYGFGNACDTTVKLQKKLDKELSNYEVEEYSQKRRLIVFFNRIPEVTDSFSEESD